MKCEAEIQAMCYSPDAVSLQCERRSPGFVGRGHRLQRFPDDFGCQRETVTSINGLKEGGRPANQHIHLYQFGLM